jgi:hypothetical protein
MPNRANLARCLVDKSSIYLLPKMMIFTRNPTKQFSCEPELANVHVKMFLWSTIHLSIMIYGLSVVLWKLIDFGATQEEPLLTLRGEHREKH